MRQFVLRQNIARYRTLVGAVMEQREKNTLVALLREAEADLRELEFVGPKNHPSAEATPR